MTITGQNFEVYQGDNKQVIISATDDEGNVLDLTGYDIVWIAYGLTNFEVVITKSSSVVGEIEVPTPANGEIHINLESTDTENLAPKTYGHQCEIKDAFDRHSTITTGHVSILKSNTHTHL